MKPASVLPLLIVLAGCGPPDEKDIAACRRQAPHVLPAHYDAIDLHQYLKLCMADHDYHFNAVMAGCGDVDAYQNAACYVR